MATPLFIRGLLWLWLLAAVYLGHTQGLAHLPAWALPLLCVALAGAVIFLGDRIKLVREWFDGVELRALVLLSVTRFVGFYFLHLFARGELPAQFAFVSGWSENLIAASALVVAVAPFKAPLRRRVLAVWNVIGFVGLVLLTYNVTRLAGDDEAAAQLFGQLPLNLLPQFLLPLLLVTHFLIHRRLERENQSAAAGPESRDS